MNPKSLAAAALFTLGALTLTACQSGTAAAGGAAAAATSAPSSASAQPTSSAQTLSSRSSTSRSSAPDSGTSDGASGSTSGSSPAAGTPAGSDGDAYAYKHPCSPQQLSVQASRRSGSSSQWVITVRNTHTTSCGLSYYPLVSLDNSKAADGSQAVTPLVPSGLGGPPAYVLDAGSTAYAVIDLDPTGATTGTVAGIDQLNVLPDGDHMPDADTLNFPLGSKASVLKPKLGLYRSNVGDAVSSMEQADTQP